MLYMLFQNKQTRISIRQEPSGDKGQMNKKSDIITKLASSGVLCGNITEFEVAMGEGDPPTPQTK